MVITEQFIKNKLSKLFKNNEYEFIKTYIKNEKRHVVLKHNKCGHEIDVFYSTFFRQNKPTRCRYCANNIKKSTADFKKEVYNLVGDEYTVVGEYKNSHTKILMKHNACGKIFEVTPGHFLDGYRHSECSYKKLGKSRRHKQEEVKERLLNCGFELVSEYTTSNTPITVKHQKCGTVFNSIYRSIVNRHVGCPNCYETKFTGENSIEAYLKSNSISYKKQVRYSDCRNIRPLPFDFEVLINNKKCLIEFNGIQHYDNNFLKNYKSEKDSLTNIQKRDKIKENYCKKNNIPLLVIKYTEINNIDNILKEYFLTFND